jgi:hypothetical protein
VPGRQIAELDAQWLDRVRHQVHERPGLPHPQRRPVEIVVGHETHVLIAADARETDTEDRRVRRAGETLDLAEGRQRDARPIMLRARERVASTEDVVHLTI